MVNLQLLEKNAKIGKMLFLTKFTDVSKLLFSFTGDKGDAGSSGFNGRDGTPGG